MRTILPLLVCAALMTGTALAQERTRSLKLTYPSGAYDTFDGNLQSYVPSLPTDDKMTAEVSFKVTGSVVRTAAP